MLHIVVNPSAGNGHAGRAWQKLEARLLERGFRLEVRFTKKRGEATAFARTFAQEGAQIVVAVGGDGTVHEVVNGLIHEDVAINPLTQLVIASAGTCKDMARTFGNRSLADTLDALETGRVETIDVGVIRFAQAGERKPLSRYFANVADIGLGADVAKRVSQEPLHKVSGTLAYLRQAIQAIRVIEGKEVTLVADGVEIFAGRTQMIVFCNGRYFAGGMHIGPAASVRDGLLDIVVLEETRRWRVLGSLLPRAYFGRHIGCKGVHHFQVANVRITASEPLHMELDGELPGHHQPIEVCMLPNALKVLLPSKLS